MSFRISDLELYARAGKHLVVFLVKGPLYLVAASAQGEPASVLRLQLETLHKQIVCILTTGFERMFTKNPRYDSRRLLGESSMSFLTLSSFMIPMQALNVTWMVLIVHCSSLFNSTL